VGLGCLGGLASFSGLASLSGLLLVSLLVGINVIVEDFFPLACYMPQNITPYLCTPLFATVLKI
jgi:hypothetical protein